jgi:23S rRNA pseudouridine2605 synthase
MLEMNTKKGGKGENPRKTGNAGKIPKTRTGAPKKVEAKGGKPKTAAPKPAAAGEKKTITARDKRKYIDFKQRVKKGDPMPKFNEDSIRLNKYLANAGVCSRRDADVLIATGVVTVNGEIITEMGFKVSPTDVVKYDNESIRSEVKRYVLLNKPKGFVTTMDDPLGRKTVMGLVIKACKERVYPIGKIDRESTGLLLFTNDGDMAKKLTHPQFKPKNLYHVECDKPVKKEHMEKMLEGIDLEDGRTAFQKAEYVKTSSHEVGVELSSGKNNVVKRAFEALGYVVLKLDRVQYAGLTKKDLPRGMYRHLTEKEVNFLKMAK